METDLPGAVLRPFLVKPGPRAVEEHPRPASDPGISPWCMSSGKRCFDLLLSLPLLLLLTPLLLIVACVIRLTSKGPALFLQERVGLHRKPFMIVKFRTMSHGDRTTGPNVTRTGDPRVTPIGSILRRLKIDELPQLVNIIRGEMSLVGPRPKLAEHEQMHLPCRPGVTGAATVAFANEEAMLASVPEHLVEEYAITVLSPVKHRLDARYVAEASLATDIRLLLRTAAKLRVPYLGRWAAKDLPTAEMPVAVASKAQPWRQPTHATLFLHPGMAASERASI